MKRDTWLSVAVVALLSFIKSGLAVRCLACVGVVQPKYCSTARFCAGSDACSIRQYRTINNQVLYDLDCSQNCPATRQLSRDVSVLTNSSITVITPMPTQTSPTTSPTTSTTTSSATTTEEFTTSIAKRLITNVTTPQGGPEELCNTCCHGDMCNANGCSSSGYPSLLTRGPVCFGCQQTADPTNCDKLAFCNRNEKCAVFEEHVFGDVVYSTRCLPSFSCQIKQPTVIGRRHISKRQRSEFLCAPCCDNDFCNIQCKGLYVRSTAKVIYGREKLRKKEKPGVPITTASTVLNTVQPPGSEQSLLGYQDKEFLIMFQGHEQVQYGYIYMSTTTSGSAMIETPHFFATTSQSLNNGRNVLRLNRTIFGRDNLLENKAIYLKSNVPMSVSGLVHSTGRTEGFMVLPLEKLGTEYKVVSESSATLFTVAAIHSNTTVKLEFNISDGGSLVIQGRSYHSGSIYTKRMGRLDTLQVYSGYDMTGTIIFADYPVAVLSGDASVDAGQPLIEYLPPVSTWGTKFIVPQFTPATEYNLRILLGDSIEGIVTIQNAQGKRTYSILHSKHVEVTLNTVPTYIESTQPILVTLFTKDVTNNVQNMSASMVWIPPFTMYRNMYNIANLNPSNASGHFAEKAVIIVPAGEVSGLRVDGIRVDYNDIHSSISDGSILYKILVVPMDGSSHIITNTDPTVKFGAFVYGVDEGGRDFPAFSFPANI